MARTPVGVNGTFEWHGDRLSEHMRSASRLSLNQAGTMMVEIARNEVRVDTQALHDSIRYEIPRSSPGSGIYRLIFGVWDHPDNRLRNKDGRIENPADYAYYQETQPDRGRPFIQPAVDEVAPQLGEILRANLPRLDARGMLDFAVGGGGFGGIISGLGGDQ